MDVVRLAAGGLVMAGRRSEPILGGCGDDLVLVELLEVVGGGDESPF
jgi:hypothetical protein